MKFRFALAALATTAMGLAIAQTPAPTPAPAAPAAAAVEIPAPPKPVGTAWVLVDYITGQVLAGENYNERVEPASITKVMTSYVLAAEQAKRAATRGYDQGRHRTARAIRPPPGEDRDRHRCEQHGGEEDRVRLTHQGDFRLVQRLL